MCLWLTWLWLVGWLAGWLACWLVGCHVHGSCIHCCTNVGIDVCQPFVFEFVMTGALIWHHIWMLAGCLAGWLAGGHVHWELHHTFYECVQCMSGTWTRGGICMDRCIDLTITKKEIYRKVEKLDFHYNLDLMIYWRFFEMPSSMLFLILIFIGMCLCF